MNRLKIKYGTPEYVVKENDKVVICNLPYSLEGWDDILKDLLWRKYRFLVSNPFYNVIKVKAAVRCKGDDVFDIQKGKKIALAKAENKIEHQVMNMLAQANTLLIDMALVIKQRAIDSKKNIEHNIEYIQKF